MTNPITPTFNTEQANGAIQLIDTAVRSLGLQAAPLALQIVMAIQQAIADANQPQQPQE